MMEPERSTKLPKSAQETWAILRRFESGEMQDIFGTLVSVETKDGQLVRTFVNLNRTRTVQVLGAIDERAMTMEFETIQSPFPVSYLNTIWWVNGNEKETELGFSLRCVPEGVSEEQLTAMYDDAWSIGISEFKKRLR
jgi:hypothetical protein